MLYTNFWRIRQYQECRHPIRSPVCRRTDGVRCWRACFPGADAPRLHDVAASRLGNECEDGSRVSARSIPATGGRGFMGEEAGVAPFGLGIGGELRVEGPGADAAWRLTGAALRLGRVEPPFGFGL